MQFPSLSKIAAAGFAALVAVGVSAAPASADPAPVTDYRVLAGVGSDTTQDVMNGISNVVTSGGNKVIASWDARGSDLIKTRSAGCQFSRPNGSGNGRKALRASENENTGEGPGVWQGVNVANCLDFARSSAYGGTSPSTSGTYTYIPLGVDAVSLAINKNGDLPTNISFAQVQRIYRCLDSSVGGTPVTPRMIQAGSGSWDFWLSKMQMTEVEINFGDYPCLAKIPTGGDTAVPNLPRVQEHDGTILNGNLSHVVPLSAAQFIAQSNVASINALTGVAVEDRRGDARLVGMRLPGQAIQQPIVGGVLNIDFPLRRDVYNVVPTADLGVPVVATTFVGANSQVCTATVSDGGVQRGVIELFGFGKRTTTANLLEAACGDPSLKANG
ncbi:hypothetical protein [Rhizomonospora bruguierae]|uniref:hypothetical protein n=1 Tax=Rhizomonospora bruguierae TaxID=1581705 RepID=UPI001BCFD160|nr:hypothetical protein [Micromonospora sp. NBRC 107566]